MGEQSGSTYGRRDIIKKTAVAGAVAWTAPVIVSSRALATDHSPGPGGCDYYYVVKIDGGPTGGTIHCPFPSGYRQLIDPTVIASVVIAGEHSDPDGGSFTLANTVTLQQVVGKKRSDECNVANSLGADSPFTVTGPFGSPGGTFHVPNSQQSHIYVVFCSHLNLGGVDAPSVSSRIGPVEDTQTEDLQTQQEITDEGPVVEEPVVEEPVVEEPVVEEPVVEEPVVEEPVVEEPVVEADPAGG